MQGFGVTKETLGLLGVEFWSCHHLKFELMVFIL